jgi:hypothetical protein
LAIFRRVLCCLAPAAVRCCAPLLLYALIPLAARAWTVTTLANLKRNERRQSYFWNSPRGFRRQPMRPAIPEGRSRRLRSPNADWTWLNGTRRNKVAVWDSKFFTPEVRLDSRRTHQYLIYYQLLTCDY